jgi:hypothetical protein
MHFESVYYLFLVAAMLAMYGVSRWLDPRRAARRAIGAVTRTAIAKLKEGERARVSGVVGAIEPVRTSPVGQHPCIGFRLTVERRRAGGSGEIWHQVLQRESCQPFWIRDETGEAIVEGPFLLGLDVDNSAWAGLPAALYKLLEEAQVQPFHGDDQLRFTEAILKPGDRITALGRAVREVSPEIRSAHSRELPMAWYVRGTENEPVALADVEEAEDASPMAAT